MSANRRTPNVTANYVCVDGKQISKLEFDSLDSRYILTSSVSSSFDSRYVLTSSISSSLDFRYVLTSSLQGTQPAVAFFGTGNALTGTSNFTFTTGSNSVNTPTLSASANVSGSGAGIFNTGYKSLLLQFAITSSLLVGTQTAMTPPFATVIPWTGSLAGMSAVAEGNQPQPGSILYIKANVNSSVIANAVLTASNVLTNPSQDFPRGLYAFKQGTLLQVTCTTAAYLQSTAGTFTGFIVSVWGYI